MLNSWQSRRRVNQKASKKDLGREEHYHLIVRFRSTYAWYYLVKETKVNPLRQEQRQEQRSKIQET